MRTTLTLDDDLLKELQEAARNSGKSLKEVVNETLRHGLSTGASPSRRVPRFRVHPQPCGFRAGIDVTKLNQLVDELEIDRAGSLVIRGKR
ncbi:MAG: type II toxin-antitoxin system VapB family antitoxin [Acidobacteria bacterium]|nr:type II toxin-antitoxin system VapB family antitoxin [Acidobacteriota bacterium]MBV9068730.1 type II toxin-antitoxin system VapB family antitoxin [Acidobacteriota bacterium]MBV9188085.1 type II toxin-antitoxin system VapB family antitoxin [Acidobacteriota bacterium]